MKNYILFLLLIVSQVSFGQSKSFETLKEKFVGSDNVIAVSTGGLILRTALWFAGEVDWRRDLGDVRNVSVITIPQKAFEDRNLRLSGFKKYVAKDDFEEVMCTRQGSELITVYMKEYDKRSNLYLVLIENHDQVTAVELKGKLDPEKLIGDTYSKKKTTRL
jgi:hypothetical protein